jgi:hypothetical protein
VTIGDRPGKLTDLKPGTRIMLKLSADRKSVVLILQPPLGRREGLPTVSGQIKAIDLKANTITLSPGRGEERTLTLGKEVKVSIDGKPAKVADLKVNSPALLRLAADQTVMAVTVGTVRRPVVRSIQGEVTAVAVSRVTIRAGRRDADAHVNHEPAIEPRIEGLLLEGAPLGPGLAALLSEGAVADLRALLPDDLAQQLVPRPAGAPSAEKVPAGLG